MREISKKIVLLGNESVGKTSLVKQYVHSIFSDEYLTTIGIKISKKQIELAEHRVKLMIWDVAGDLLDQSLYDAYLKGAHGFILVFEFNKTRYLPQHYSGNGDAKNAFPRCFHTDRRKQVRPGWKST